RTAVAAPQRVADSLHHAMKVEIPCLKSETFYRHPGTRLKRSTKYPSLFRRPLPSARGRVRPLCILREDWSRYDSRIVASWLSHVQRTRSESYPERFLFLLHANQTDLHK